MAAFNILYKPYEKDPKQKSLPWSKARRQRDSCSVVDVKSAIKGAANLRNDFETLSFSDV